VPGKSDEVIRPNPLQWLRYVYTGSVPWKNHAWVLYDATCRTWVLRHIVRYFVLISPLFAAVLVFLPAPMTLRLMSCLAAALPMALFYLAYTTDALDRRVEKAGYLPGTATTLREERATAAQRATVARYHERRAARLNRQRRI
jgi:hypothetical protein